MEEENASNRKLATQIFDKITETEKELRRNLSKKKNLFDFNVVNLRNSLRDEYEKLLFIDYQFSILKEVEQNLWKNVFYKVIEEFRKRIRKHVPSPTNENNKTSDDLQKICESFKSFLFVASKFYQDLIGKFVSKYNLIIDGSVDYSSEKNHQFGNSSYLSCHRSLIFLGDLARYHRDLYGHQSQRDWIRSAQFYQQALLLVPDNGNPHNQLAVLATYADDELNAVYHYFLSLAVANPFLTARDNLSVLFEKNRLKTYNEENESQKDYVKGTRNFISKFVRMHGIIFNKKSLEQIDSLKFSLLKDFEQILRDNSESNEDFVFKIVVMNICSIHNCFIENSSNPQAFEAKITQYCITIAFEFFHMILKLVSKKHSSYLTSLCLFLDYLRSNPDNFRNILPYIENSFWKDLTILLNSLTQLYEIKTENFSILLPEEVELRGFFPLRDLYRNITFKSDLVVASDSPLAKEKVIFKIKEFGIFVSKYPETQIISFDIETQRWNYILEPLMKNDRIQPTKIKTNTNDILIDEEDTDEIIVFKPWEGIKVGVEHENNQPAIGSGRSDRPIETAYSNSYSPFDLFGNSISSSEMFSKHGDQIINNKNHFNSFFGAKKTTSNYSINEINEQMPLQENSFFDGSFQKINPGIVSTSVAQQDSNSWLEQTIGNEDSQLVFPFPGGQNLQRYKTRNPFIS